MYIFLLLKYRDRDVLCKIEQMQLEEKQITKVWKEEETGGGESAFFQHKPAPYNKMKKKRNIFSGGNCTRMLG